MRPLPPRVGNSKCGCLWIAHDGNSCQVWRDLFEHRKPLAHYPGLVKQHAGHIVAGTRKTGDKAYADRIRNIKEYNWDRVRCPVKRGGDLRRMRNNRIWLGYNQLLRLRRISIALSSAEAIIEVEIAAKQPS